jgi:lantibiotic modifying enzyme
MNDDSLVEAALAEARNLASTAEPAGDGLTWQAEIVVGIEAERAVIGHGDVGMTLYDGTAGIAVGLAAGAIAAPHAEATRFAEAARGAARHALSGAQDLLDSGRIGLFDGATGIAWSAVITGKALGERRLVDQGLSLSRAVVAHLEAEVSDAGNGSIFDLIGGLAGTLLGLQGAMSAAGESLPMPVLGAMGRRLATAAVPQTWGVAWPDPADRAGGPPLLGFGHGAAGIALALAEVAALADDEELWRVSAEGLEYERGWFDPDLVAWPDLRAPTETGEPTGWMAAWCHGAIGIGLSRLRLTRLTGERLALAEASAALQAGRQLVVNTGTALRAGQTSDCTACHGLGGVVELMLVAAKALDVPGHASAARRVAGLLVEERNAANGVWPCGLPGAGAIPGLMTGTAGIVLTLLRAAGATNLPTPLLPGPTGW